MSNILVSVVSISKDNYQSLFKTLESVKALNYQKTEHIIIDGDFNDGSKQLLKSYSHSKVYKFFSESDSGISSAFNKGLNKSTGDLIFFLNSGDLFSSDTVISEVVESYLVQNGNLLLVLP